MGTLFRFITRAFLLPLKCREWSAGARPPLACAERNAAAYVVNAALGEKVDAGTTRKPFPCTHPLTPSTRLDRLQLPLFMSSV